MRLAHAEEVEIGAVEDEDVGHEGYSEVSRLRRRSCQRRFMSSRRRDGAWGKRLEGRWFEISSIREAAESYSARFFRTTSLTD
jgi:hypothetical protein